MRKRFDELRKDQKGFTLVELIVVLVILAIMAALLAPALLGYIDKARSSKYLEECRSITTAMQAMNDELYAKNKNPLDSDFKNSSAKYAEVNKLVYPTSVSTATIVYKTGTKNKDKYIISYLSALTFTSQDGSTITASQTSDGEWTVSSIVTSGNTTNIVD